MSARRSLQHPTERDNQETELVSELHTRGKALELFRSSGSLYVTQSSSVVLESCSTCSVDSRIRKTVLLVLDTWSDRSAAVHHCQEANTLHQLVFLLTRNWLSHPWSTVPRLKRTRVLPLNSVFVKDTTLFMLRLTLFQKADSFPQRLYACLFLCFSCDPCFSAGCCCHWWNCRMLLHLVSSSPSPNVQFCHSSCTCWCL